MRIDGTAVVRLLVVALGLGTATAAGAQPTDVHARLDGIFAPWSGPTSPGCAVGVERSGEPPLLRAYGMAELEHGVMNTPVTVFEAGSVSKQFTVAAVVLLAQEGKLSLDDEVRTHVPELPDYGAPLTLRHLIHHTSGLRDWGTVVAAAGWPRTSRVHTHAHALDVIGRQRALNYTPGAEYSYTNSGYNLLAIIVERVSGQSFAEFSRERLFEPLGMRSTQWRDDFTRLVPGRATAYATRQGSTRILMPFENVHGNGGLLTTVGDLLAWNRNLESGEVGGQALLEELHRPGRLNDGREISYAGGLMLGEHRSVPEVSHGGATAGYRAFLARYPEDGLSVALLCNTGDVNPGSLARRTAELFLQGRVDDATPAPAVRLPARALATRAGLYRSLRTHEPLRITLEGDVLRLEGRAALVPLSADAFRVGSQRLRFDADPENRGGFVLVDSDGDEVAYVPVAPVTPGAGALEELVGSYRSGEAEAEYRVHLEEGALTMELRPHVRLPLTPVYADAFTTPSGWLVRFIRTPEGRVVEMSLGMGRVRDLRFARLD